MNVQPTDNLQNYVIPPLQIGSHTLSSRLILGSGRYRTLVEMRDSLLASGTGCVTVAVRRERLFDEYG